MSRLVRNSGKVLKNGACIANSQHKVGVQFHTSSFTRSNFHPLARHKDTADNTDETYFDFTPENFKRVSNLSLCHSF